MSPYQLDDLVKQRAAKGDLYLEFLRVPSMSMGLYQLAAGAYDPQLPHTEDEIYYITQGCGMIRVGDEDHDIQAGSIIFVAATVDHKFHSITEDLTILVFFAPAEYSNKNQQA